MTTMQWHTYFCQQVKLSPHSLTGFELNFPMRDFLCQCHWLFLDFSVIQNYLQQFLSSTDLPLASHRSIRTRRYHVLNIDVKLQTNFYYKTVLLRERKRHTDRIACPLLHVLSWRGGGGYPRQAPPPQLGVPPPNPDLARGVPQVGAPWLGVLHPRPDLARGVPRQVPPGWGTPPSWPGQGVPRVGTPWLGYPHPQSRPGHGGTPGGHPLGWGTPLSGPGRGTPPPQVWTNWKHYLPSSFGCGR